MVFGDVPDTQVNKHYKSLTYARIGDILIIAEPHEHLYVGRKAYTIAHLVRKDLALCALTSKMNARLCVIVFIHGALVKNPYKIHVVKDVFHLHQQSFMELECSYLSG